MTPDQTAQIKRLYKLVALSEELGDLINLKLCDQWCAIREQHGLALTLQLIQEYNQFNHDVEATTKDNFTVNAPEIEYSNSDPSMV